MGRDQRSESLPRLPGIGQGQQSRGVEPPSHQPRRRRRIDDAPAGDGLCGRWPAQDESVVERGRDRLGQDERADTLAGTADRCVHQAQTSELLGRREVDAHGDAVTQRPSAEAWPEGDQEARGGMHGGPGDQGHAASKIDSLDARQVERDAACLGRRPRPLTRGPGPP